MSEHNTQTARAEQAEVEYRDIPGWPGYRVGNDGSVWSCRPLNGRGALLAAWRRLKTSPGGPDGRPYVCLCPGRRQFAVHRLVLLAFVGPCPDGMECCHGDGNHRNNVLSNLRWDTPSANHHDKERHGTHNKGSRHNMAKLTEDRVRQIRDEYAAGGITQQALADFHRVSIAMICMIVNRRNWTHV